MCLCIGVVAGKLAMKGMYKINLKSEVKVEVGPAYEYKLEKFQVRHNTLILLKVLFSLINA